MGDMYWQHKSLMSLLAAVLLASCFALAQDKALRFSGQNHGVRSAHNFSLASYYGDHMVLQQGPQRASIWGYGSSSSSSVGQTVTVTVEPGAGKFQGIVRSDQKWVVTLDPVISNSTYTITAKCGSHEIKITDVLFGDVWICSGQSNMQFGLSQVYDAPAEIADVVNYPNIRVLKATDVQSKVPLDDLAVDTPWSRPDNESIGGSAWKSFSAVCWLYGKYLYQKLRRPLGLVETCWGGTPVEAWSSPDALQKCGLTKNRKPSLVRVEKSYGPAEMSVDEERFGGPQEYSVLWNAMIYPLLNMTIYGAIWYQGENNARLNMDLYNCTFPAMIDDWRLKFHNSLGESSLTFPFGFVQLAADRPDFSIHTGFSDIRWHQTADYGYVPNQRMKNVFMAVAMDLPDFTSPYSPIHPRDKQTVASRLVLGSLAVAYNDKNVSFEGPRPTEIRIEEYNSASVVYITFKPAASISSVIGLEICCGFTTPPVCETGKSWWYPAMAYQLEDSVFALTNNCEHEHIVGLRYAWEESPCTYKRCCLYGTYNDLPAPPFVLQGKLFVREKVGNAFVVKVP